MEYNDTRRRSYNFIKIIGSKQDLNLNILINDKEDDYIKSKNKNLFDGFVYQVSSEFREDLKDFKVLLRSLEAMNKKFLRE